MIDRRVLDHGVRARVRIDGNRQDRHRLSVLDLLDEDRAIGAIDIGEAARRAVGLKVKGQLAIAARTAQRSGHIDRIRSVADAFCKPRRSAVEEAQG